LLKEKPKFVYMLEVGVFSKKNTKINKKLWYSPYGCVYVHMQVYM
jgi:hypothetical protein